VADGDGASLGDEAGLIPTGEDLPDLDEMVLGSLAATVARLAILSGPVVRECVFVKPDGDKLTVRVVKATPGASWRDRLRDTGKLAKAISQHHGLPEAEVARSLLDLDGWVLTGGHLKTPAWMFDHAELDFSEAACFEGMEWLASS